MTDHGQDVLQQAGGCKGDFAAYVRMILPLVFGWPHGAAGTAPPVWRARPCSLRFSIDVAD
jgi:hypothetical protein